LKNDKTIMRFINFLKQYHNQIISIAAIGGLFFGGYQTWQFREDKYFQYRPYVNLATINFLSSDGIEIEIKNDGLSTAQDIILGLFRLDKSGEKEERLTYRLTSGANMEVVDDGKEYEVTIIGLVGDLNPNAIKKIKIQFLREEETRTIRNENFILVIKIIYDDYLHRGNEHNYYLQFNRENESFYISDEFEERAGNERTLFIHKFL